MAVLVCVARIFFQALFSQILIFTCRGHFQELQLNNDLADFSTIWPDARKIYNQQKRVGEFDLFSWISNKIFEYPVL